MTKEEIAKKAYEAYPIQKVNLLDENLCFPKEIDSNALKRLGYITALTEFSKFPTIHGWVARDSVEDAFSGTGLILHHTKPSRIGGEWSSSTITMHLPSTMFPELKWEDEPIEVNLIIQKI